MSNLVALENKLKVGREGYVTVASGLKSLITLVTQSPPLVAASHLLLSSWTFGPGIFYYLPQTLRCKHCLEKNMRSFGLKDTTLERTQVQ